jgi:T-complex protein 1 subunit beta
MIGNEKMIKFEKKAKNANSIILRGSSKEVLDEAERAIHDALCVLSKMDKFIVYGGGATEMSCGVALNEYAMTISGEESESILAFSRSLQRIPEILATNCGFSGAKFKTEMRAEHTKKNKYAGVDIKNGCVGNMKEVGVVESFRVKMRIFSAAVEAAQMIIKVDGFVKCKPRERERH